MHAQFARAYQFLRGIEPKQEICAARSLSQKIHLISQALAQTFPRARKEREFRLQVRNTALCRRRGRCRAKICDEIQYRDIGFVPDRRNDGCLTGINRPRDPFVVKTPEILHGAAAAPHNHHIHTVGIQRADAAHNALRRVLSLDQRREEHNLDIGILLMTYGSDVVNGRTARAGHDTEGLNESRQRLFVRRVKESLGLQRAQAL